MKVHSPQKKKKLSYPKKLLLNIPKNNIFIKRLSKRILQQLYGRHNIYKP